jgi:fatty acid desaturase
MGGYRKNPHWDWEDAAAGMAVAIALLVLAVIVTVAILLATEVVRIYRERAREGGEIGRFLWTALAGLLLCWGVAAVFMAIPGTFPIGLAVATWGFLAFAVAVEIVDWHAGKMADAYLLTSTDATLPDVLRPWPDAA